MNKAVFFDRDGVLNRDIGYLYRIEDFHWIKGAIESIKKFNERNYYTFVVTNQSGVARGYYTEQDIKILHNWINTQLTKYGAHIDEFFYCPHYEYGIIKRYSHFCECRKPNPKMIDDACKKYYLNKKMSLLIGDRDSDIICAKNAGIKGYKFVGNDLFDFINNIIFK
ncbi:D-glycero-alpha-D-manno-heptose-1,7-bisphosphate 7-phosphatase [Pectinatus frisingensis]|uniref:D-glycero-alpha-D-manno-heptose-1,7-bisphosphate 7-phosphatase n=1 Tax=Pectinatus frisingensis TaxID=865 RepID=UPI001E515E7A|nr:HAD family hydrolase [Pectinatus frisingensis]